MAKLIIVAILANQLLTLAFVSVVEQIDPDSPVLMRSVFSFVTCVLLSSWLQADARRAYLVAREKGCITPVDGTHPTLSIAPNCPRRWLVILHIEMNPAIVGISA
ncbi:hypothetical protein [Caballeronia sordidicola]|uniref:hypothetical protein n=1 Tax=Caballeronia sordidicola TaxID=196367 RepID=UPI00211A17D1|nr:hypothetical protein [Caballeronia sordidicola]